MRHAVIGAGWAGCAAAVELASKGHQVSLFESSRVLGGRARAVELHGQALDNGQHILLGAYQQSLRLMKLVGIDVSQALLRLPLQMRYPPANGGLDFVAARLPAPLHLLAALWRAQGLAREDKLALARFSSTARWMGWRLHDDCSVAELLERFDQTARLIKLMWRPLCLAALNTAPEQASAQVFLNVLRDSLGASRKASDMLLPRQDLSTLFPAAAARFVERAGGVVCRGKAVTRLARQAQQWRLSFHGDVLDALDAPLPNTAPASGGDPTTDHAALQDLLFDSVILATPAWETAKLFADLDSKIEFPDLTYEPITTCYLQYGATLKLPLPFYALLDDGANGDWGQFVFDRGHLHPEQAGLLAVVVSASSQAIEIGNTGLSKSIVLQLMKNFAMPELAAPLWTKVISEKRATFACTPGLARVGNASGLDGLAIAGDFTASDYPATLESAMRSGIGAATLAMKTHSSQKRSS